MLNIVTLQQKVEGLEAKNKVLETQLQTKENESAKLEKMFNTTNMVVEHLRYSCACLIRKYESLNKRLEEGGFNRELGF